MGETDLRAFVEQCLNEAEVMGEVLNGAARALAAGLLSMGDRKPHKDDVSKLARSFPHQVAYWSALEGHFADWISQLGPDFEKQQARLERAWREILQREALQAWRLAALAAGTMPGLCGPFTRARAFCWPISTNKRR